MSSTVRSCRDAGHDARRERADGDGPRPTCGPGDGKAAAWYVGPDGPQPDAVPCAEVLEAYDEHQLVLARTAGGEPDAPLGAPEPAAEADDWVAFDFVDDGTYEGRAIVQRAGDGWYVRRVINCRGDETVVEDDDGRG